MNGHDRKERRAIVNVADGPVEMQGMLQTILTFLILAVMSWVGINLEQVKDNTALNNKNIALFAKDLSYQGKTLDTHIKVLNEHMNDRKAHNK